MTESTHETVLIIGGAGQIGTQVTAQEIAAGHDVHVFGRSPASSSKTGFITQAPNGHYTSVDVGGNQAALAAHIKKINPDKIYFLAEPFPMSDAAVESSVKQMSGFYDTLLSKVGYKGPIVVVGTAGIEMNGPHFPLQSFDAQAERLYGQIPYFRNRRLMAATCRAYETKGLDIRRVALPWVVSGDAHHGDLEPLPQYASGSMNNFGGIPDVALDAIPAAEAARAIRFVAEKGQSGWTYQAGGVPAASTAAQMQVELAEINAAPVSSSPTSRGKIIEQATMLLRLKRMKSSVQRNPFLMGMNIMWEGYARSQFNISSDKTIQETLVAAATGCALLSVLPRQADMSALKQLGFVPTEMATLKQQVASEARRHARLLLRDGLVRSSGRPPASPRPRY